MKESILKALRETDGYISGQELSQKLGVSRTAVWKTIHQLTDEGYQIEAVNRKGYRLIDEPDVLTKTEIESRLKPGCVGSRVIYYDRLASTNDEARLLAEQGAPHGTLVVAEEQTGGKGRKRRPWSSPPGIGIWMSFILRPQIEPDHASRMTLLAAMAVYDAVRELNIPCQIKWPNDIVIDGKKVCGILTEMSATQDSINYVVVGIGLNVHNQEFPEGIRDVAISLDMAKNLKEAKEAEEKASTQRKIGSTIHRSALIARILERFEYYYQQFLKKEDLAFIQDAYNARLVNRGQTVYVIDKEQTRSGQCRGIDETGCLVVLMDGKEEHILSGEVSVRGVLGYV